MCQKLGIELIGANSPQAQGRVERSHGTHQHRLIKKMRLKRIATYEQAHAFLVETYLPAHNARYAIAASHALDLHEPVAQHVDLDDVFCLEPQRTLSQDAVVQYGSRWLPIEPEPYDGNKVPVRQRRDGSLKLVCGERVLRWHEIDTPAAKPRPAPKLHRPQRPNHPAIDHPWRKRFLTAHA